MVYMSPVPIKSDNKSEQGVKKFVAENHQTE